LNWNSFSLTRHFKECSKYTSRSGQNEIGGRKQSFLQKELSAAFSLCWGEPVARRVRTEHIYEVEASRLWSSCVSYADLAETMASLVTYQGLPDGELQAGQRLELKVTHFRITPPVPWWIEVLERDDQRRVMKTSERGGSMKSYLHIFTVEELDAKTSRLIDDIEFEAGWLNIPMTWWIRYIYKTRDAPRRRILGLN
jgi:ligand-binding SRPBCC domain-containing protein